MAKKSTMTAKALADYILMPRTLTAENRAKALLAGEFTIQHTATCAACSFDEPQEDCEVCYGEVEYTETIIVDWPTIKDIYTKAVEGLAKELPDLPCDVMLPPATIIRRGCGLNSLLSSLSLREGQPEELCTIQRPYHSETEQRWAVHAQGQDELWATESREQAEQHASELNALPGQTDSIKVNAVVVPSPWSEVDHWKTLAEQWRYEAEDRIASLQALQKHLENLEANRRLLASMSMEKTLDIVTIGEALGIPGEEQQGGISEFIVAIERLRDATQAATSQICKTMQRPKAECGCPDCGSSLVDWPKYEANPATTHTEDPAVVPDCLRHFVEHEFSQLAVYADGRTPLYLTEEQYNAIRAMLVTAPAAQADHRPELSQAAADVFAERRRQIEAEGFSPECDDQYRVGELATAAGCYLLFSDAYPNEGQPPAGWPWADSWWKPTTYRQNQIKAGALILADIERLDRASLRIDQEAGQ